MRQSQQWCSLGVKGEREGGTMWLLYTVQAPQQTCLQSLCCGASETFKMKASGAEVTGTLWMSYNLGSLLWAGPTLCNPSCLSGICRHKCPSSLRIIIVVIGYRSLSFWFSWLFKLPHYLISPPETIHTHLLLHPFRSLCWQLVFLQEGERTWNQLSICDKSGPFLVTV